MVLLVYVSYKMVLHGELYSMVLLLVGVSSIIVLLLDVSYNMVLLFVNHKT